MPPGLKRSENGQQNGLRIRHVSCQPARGKSTRRAHLATFAKSRMKFARWRLSRRTEKRSNANINPED
jgi:hypothetical protein